jgi:hypothetical protein
MHSPRPPKAFSYTRFSTADRPKATALHDKRLPLKRWAEQRGVELDNELTFRDEGVSASRE